MKPLNKTKNTMRLLLESNKNAVIPVWLGDLHTGQKKASENGDIYVTFMDTGNVITVFNDQVPLIYKSQILIGYDKKIDALHVVGSRNQFPQRPYADLVNHATTHQWPNSDTLFMRKEQLVDGLVEPIEDTLTVQVYSFNYVLAGVSHTCPNVIVDLTSEIPTSGAEWLWIEIDADKAITFNHGDNYDNRFILTPENLPTPSADKYVVIGLKVYAEQNSFIKTNYDTDFFDPRFVNYGGGGAVETVTGDGVDNTDPANPVLTYPTPADIGADVSGAAATAETNAKAYADGLVVGLWDDRGSYNASGGAYPSTGGSGIAGAIKKGDAWTVSVAGTLPTSQVVEVGDLVRALIDTPGNTQANWAITQNNIGYTAENSANKNASGGYVGLTALKINFINAANTFTSFLVNAATAARTYTFPDKDITVVGTVDIREKLTANRTYYINTAGHDTASGLNTGTNATTGAFLTFAKAWATICSLDLNGFTATIQLDDGTFTTGLSATLAPFGGPVIIKGNSSTPANTIVSTTSTNAIAISCLADVTLQNFEVRTTTAGHGVQAENGAKVTIGAGMRFGACAESHMRFKGTGYIFSVSNYTISGGATYHLYGQLGGMWEGAGQTVTLSGTPNFTGPFANVDNATLSAYSITYSGAITVGVKKYSVILNGAIQSFGLTTFPGSVAGTTDGTGAYA